MSGCYASIQVFLSFIIVKFVFDFAATGRINWTGTNVVECNGFFETSNAVFVGDLARVVRRFSESCSWRRLR